MAETSVIMKRELRGFFLSPVAYVVGAAFLFLPAFFWFPQIFLDTGTSAEARMTGYFTLMPWAMLVLASALTMRQWAEERKIGTLELLLTYPVTTMQLVTGKFLASFFFIGILLLMTMSYPLTLSMFGNLDWGPVIGGYLGTWLLGAACLSFGLFASSITNDQIVSLIVSLVVLLVMFLAPQLAIIVFGTTHPGIQGFFTVTSPHSHFASIARGVVDMGDLLYYLVFCSFFLFLNSAILEVKKRVG